MRESSIESKYRYVAAASRADVCSGTIQVSDLMP